MPTSQVAEALRRSSRSPHAFGAFYRHHVAALFSYLNRRVYDTDVALDLTSESFAQAYLSRRRFRGRTDPQAAAWLYRIADRQLARYFRSNAIEQRALTRLGIDPPQLHEGDHARVEQLADSAGLRAAVRGELERLSTEQRDALRLRVVDDLSYGEVANRLRISEEAARARVMRGLKALAQSLKQNSLPEETRP